MSSQSSRGPLHPSPFFLSPFSVALMKMLWSALCWTVQHFFSHFFIMILLPYWCDTCGWLGLKNQLFTCICFSGFVDKHLFFFFCFCVGKRIFDCGVWVTRWELLLNVHLFQTNKALLHCVLSEFTWASSSFTFCFLSFFCGIDENAMKCSLLNCTAFFLSFIYYDFTSLLRWPCAVDGVCKPLINNK